MNHRENLALLLLLLYTICHFPQILTAASLPTLSKDADKPPSEPLNQTVISLTRPVSETVSLTVGDGKVEVKPPVAPESCELAANKCRGHDGVNVTACLFPSAGAGDAILVLNDGEGSLKFNVTINPSEPNSDAIEVPAHKARKINLSASISNASSVVLKADNWTCTIQLRVPAPLSSQSSQSHSYDAYITPVNGAYLLFVTALLIGLIWACCKLKRARRPSDGIPYQELEMGQKQSTKSINMETAVGWDQHWDDDWDEEKAVRSPGGHHIGNRRVNGGGSRFEESNGWDDDWKV